MATDSVQLTSAMRANLLQLQGTQANIGKKENILATGNKINSALDGPTSYFASKTLSTRASDLSGLKDAMGQSISTIQAANKGLEKIDGLIDQAKGLTTSAYSALNDDAASVATRANLAKQFNEILKQINGIAQDSGYAGKNLLAGDGTRLDSTTASRGHVNSINGIGNARVTNVVSTDTYAMRVSGDGAITANPPDVGDVEKAHGLIGFNMSGTMDSSHGTFSDVSLTVSGAAGQSRSFVISDGNETRTINYFDNTQSATYTTQAATTTSGTQTTVSIGGTIEAGDTFSVKVDGQIFSYTATAADVALGQNAANNVATKLRASIQTSLTSPTDKRLAGSSLASLSTVTPSTGTSFVLTGKTDSSGQTIVNMVATASADNAISLHISQSFASGSVVSFTVDRKAMEAATAGGNGTSTVQKRVNIQIQAQNLDGTLITRSGMNVRGEGKLSDGENSFAFTTGTARVTVDQAKIMQAAVLNQAANLTTTQVSAPNTQNDLNVQFNETNTNSITIKSQSLTADGQGLRLDEASNNWMDRTDIDAAVSNITYAKNHLRSVSQSLSTNLNIVTTREDFTKEFSDVLTEGANKLIQADQNEEAAQLLALQTRQQLGTTALSIANQSQQAILKLF